MITELLSIYILTALAAVIVMFSILYSEYGFKWPGDLVRSSSKSFVTISSCLVLALTCLWMFLARTGLETGQVAPQSHDDEFVERALPVVDLGYALYRPTNFNATGRYFNFTNIRYAAPPTGNLRFSAPRSPVIDRDFVNDGTVGYICPQAPTKWYEDAVGALPGKGAAIPPGVSDLEESEDCLFLDVVVPSKPFEEGKSGRAHLTPVLFNIHGGGNFIGSKGATNAYSPGGLLERSNNSMIYVAINYRLGAFDFLSHLANSQANVTAPNAGLQDQRRALKRVQKYIYLFGGDATQVTILGESAGGANTLYHTLAYGGSNSDENDLFRHAIAQSPYLVPTFPEYGALSANLFLQAAGVSSVDEARKLSTETLMKANSRANYHSPTLVLYFGPTVAGDLVPDLPLRLLSQGRFNKNVKMITSYNEHETVFLTNNSVLTDGDFDDYIQVAFSSSPPVIRDYITRTLYPPIYDGTLPYVNAQDRLRLLNKEFQFSCPSYSLAKAYNGHTHTYIFGVTPAYHAVDLAYTYYPTGGIPGAIPAVAELLQDYFINHTLYGDPNGKDGDTKGLPQWPLTTQQGTALNFTVEGPVLTTADAFNERCEWWDKGFWSPEDTSSME